MGLSIYYRMRIRAQAARARDLVTRLHRFATTLDLNEVSDPIEIDAPDGSDAFEKGEASERGGWKPGDYYLERKRTDGRKEIVRVPAAHVIFFCVNHPGAETAMFGLASYPPVVIHREDLVLESSSGGGEQRKLGAGATIEFPTRLGGMYAWSNCCKTQYAANPKCGGIDNFLKIHQGLFQICDECRRLGMKTRVRDDSSYWRDRDPDKLIAELRKWDELVAGFAGKLGDAMSARGATEMIAPIKDRPDFEHLEARGAERLKDWPDDPDRQSD